MTAVDLHRAGDDEPTGGIVTFRNGRRFFSGIVGQDGDGDYEVRAESGWYVGYTRDGRRCDLKPTDDGLRWLPRPGGPHDYDIVAFERTDDPGDATLSNPFVDPFPSRVA